MGRKRVRRVMARMGLAAAYQRPRTTARHPQHRVWPYLLRNMTVDAPDQVWCADITYIPMRRGFLYLVAIMDWFSRRVLGWRLSNTMEADVCIEALEEAMARFGRPTIFNTDQGSQFTSPRFTEVLVNAGLRISMDGRGRWMDNVFIARLWRSLKYECIDRHAYETGSEACAGIRLWVTYDNGSRPHSPLGGRTPEEVHQGLDGIRPAAQRMRLQISIVGELVGKEMALRMGFDQSGDDLFRGHAVAQPILVHDPRAETLAQSALGARKAQSDDQINADAVARGFIGQANAQVSP